MRTQSLLLPAVLVVACVPAFPADQATHEAADQDTLAEVIVTSQKRTERLQDVPVSVQVVGGQTLLEQNHNSLDELSQTLPGVHVGNSGGNNYSNNLYIRGVGSGNGAPAGNPSYDQSVAMFIDDIYNGRSRTSGAAFVDLERIEVLKGPQSTFFGNNAIAGALNIVTAKPGDTFEGWARALYGMYGQYAVEGAAGGPINDILGVRVAVTDNGGSGWIRNVSTGEVAPVSNNKAGRVTFAFRPTDDWDALLKTEVSANSISRSTGDQPEQLIGCPPMAPFVPAAVGGLGGLAGSGNCAQILALGLPTGLDNNENTGLARQGSSLSTFGEVLTVDYHKWDHTFTSVSGFSSYHFEQNSSSIFPTEIYTARQQEKYHQFSEELRVASPSGSAIEYLAGLYFQTDRLTQSINVNIPYFDFLAHVPGLTALQEYLPLSYQPAFTQGEQVYSAFGSIGWNITTALKLNAGLRGSWDDKVFSGSLHYGTTSQVYGGFTPIPLDVEPLWSLLLGAPAAQSLTRSDHALMPSAGAQYKLSPEAMLYFTYANGFKAGGFNGLFPNYAPSNILFGPEHVNSYEVGIKSKWLEDKMLLNVDVFRADYRDLQANTAVIVPPVNTVSLYVRNAAASRSQGVELEWQWAVAGGLRLGINAAYLDSRYLSYPNAGQTTLQSFCAKSYVLPHCSAYGNPVPAVADLSGQATNFAPRWSGSLNASYSMMLPGDYGLTTELSPYVTSSYNVQDPYLLGTRGYIRLDARVTLALPVGHASVDLIGKNLTDRVIVTSYDSQNLGTKEEPRNVAVQFRYKW
jgi:iron complex outermembrane recepter protein